uniref:Uncharacterized protein n=1 Tax=Glossina austeni TaxID=7395 RepID=A0A1A9VY15_GLOAU
MSKLECLSASNFIKVLRSAVHESTAGTPDTRSSEQPQSHLTGNIWFDNQSECRYKGFPSIQTQNNNTFEISAEACACYKRSKIEDTSFDYYIIPPLSHSRTNSLCYVVVYMYVDVVASFPRLVIEKRNLLLVPTNPTTDILYIIAVCTLRQNENY